MHSAPTPDGRLQAICSRQGIWLGRSVVLEPDMADMARRGSAGTVSWPGASEDGGRPIRMQNSVFVFLAHNMVDLAQMAHGVGLGVWAALDDAQRIALCPN